MHSISRFSTITNTINHVGKGDDYEQPASQSASQAATQPAKLETKREMGNRLKAMVTKIDACLTEVECALASTSEKASVQVNLNLMSHTYKCENPNQSLFSPQELMSQLETPLCSLYQSLEGKHTMCT